MLVILNNIESQYQGVILKVDNINNSLEEITWQWQEASKQLQNVEKITNILIDPKILWARITPTLRAGLHVKPSFEVDPSLDLNFIFGHLPDAKKPNITFEKYMFQSFFQKGSIKLRHEYQNNQEQITNLKRFINSHINPYRSYHIILTGRAAKKVLLSQTIG
jgi:hypothetical protein